MTEQLMLSSFAQETISTQEFAKDFRPWNNLVFEWDVEYSGYRRDDGETEGYIDFHVIVQIVEALVKIRDTKTRNKVETPGYKLLVTQIVAYEGKEWDSSVVYDECFQKDQLKRAFDGFQREVLNIQGWIEIAESRARLMPKRRDVFECFFCGWVTDISSDDIMCHGCGKRFWSEKLMKKQTSR